MDAFHLFKIVLLWIRTISLFSLSWSEFCSWVGCFEGFGLFSADFFLRNPTLFYTLKARTNVMYHSFLFRMYRNFYRFARHFLIVSVWVSSWIAYWERYGYYFYLNVDVYCYIWDVYINICLWFLLYNVCTPVM